MVGVLYLTQLAPVAHVVSAWTDGHALGSVVVEGRAGVVPDVELTLRDGAPVSFVCTSPRVRLELSLRDAAGRPVWKGAAWSGTPARLRLARGSWRVDATARGGSASSVDFEVGGEAQEVRLR